MLPFILNFGFYLLHVFWGVEYTGCRRGFCWKKSAKRERYVMEAWGRKSCRVAELLLCRLSSTLQCPVVWMFWGSEGIPLSAAHLATVMTAKLLTHLEQLLAVCESLGKPAVVVWLFFVLQPSTCRHPYDASSTASDSVLWRLSSFLWLPFANQCTWITNIKLRAHGVMSGRYRHPFSVLYFILSVLVELSELLCILQTNTQWSSNGLAGYTQTEGLYSR